MLLQTLPEIIRMADTAARKDLLYKFIQKLMDRL
jgi:hypothetical protein